jgi:hypothetical protein
MSRQKSPTRTFNVADFFRNDEFRELFAKKSSLHYTPAWALDNQHEQYSQTEPKSWSERFYPVAPYPCERMLKGECNLKCQCQQQQGHEAL